MKVLDDWASFREVDPKGMLQCISELPLQCRQAWDEVQKLELPPDYRQVDKVLVMGMGGSAIGGDLLRTLAEGECPVPIWVNRGYEVPAFTDEHTLAIASSYSGNTEETLSAFEEARRKGAKLVALTSGGKLGQRAVELGIPFFRITYQAQPRAALGHSIVPLLGILQQAGLLADKGPQVEEATQVMEALQAEIKESVPTEVNPAKQLALDIHGRLPVVYGGFLSQVARRWKGQFNENAKSWAFFEEFPELNHNAVMGYRFPPEMADRVMVVMLASSLDHPRVRLRFKITQELLERDGVRYRLFEARGESPLAQVLSAVHFGDYVSFYLAMLHRVDPTSVEAIAYLKERLAAE